MTRYYCKKYKGFVTEQKAFNCCLKKCCPHVTRWSKRMQKQYPIRWAKDKAGTNKSVWQARRVKVGTGRSN